MITRENLIEMMEHGYFIYSQRGRFILEKHPTPANPDLSVTMREVESFEAGASIALAAIDDQHWKKSGS